jgi:hypothetical protein
VDEVVTVEARPSWTPSRVSTIAAVRQSVATAARVTELPLNVTTEELPLRPTAAPIAAAPIAETFLGERRADSDGRQRGLAVAAAILFVVVAGGAYWLLSDPSAPATATVATQSAAPLELISLRHERTGRRLSLSGLVRNPAGGASVEGLSAVVFLFDAQGGFVSSARADVDFKRLAPGDESPFVIAVDAPTSVARYRVSFRTDAGVLAHVDRRSETPSTTAIAGAKS